MADLNVQFREEERIPVTFQTENAYHWDVVFRGNEELQPIVFSSQDRSMPVTFHEDGINGEIFGGVNYIVHDYGDLGEPGYHTGRDTVSNRGGGHGPALKP